LVILAYSKFKNIEKFESFTKELYVFLQINLIVSTLFAFIFITTQAMIATILTVLVYLIVSLNFIYLSYMYDKRVFNYTAPFLLVATGFELYKIAQQVMTMEITSISLFVIALLLFFLVYYKSYSKYLCNIRNSSGLMSLILVAVAVLVSVYNKQWIISTLILYFSNYMLYLIKSNSKNELIIRVTTFSMPIAILLGSVSLYGEINELLLFSWYDAAYHFGVCLLVLFLLSLGWNRLNKAIGSAFFSVTYVCMPLAIVILGVLHYDNPIIFVISTLVYFYATWTQQKELIKKIFLYAAFITASLALWSMFVALKLELQQNYVMLMMTVLMSLFWYVDESEWKNRIVPFLIAYSVIGSFVFNSTIVLGIRELFPAFVYIVILLFVMHREKLEHLIFIPLLLLMQIMNILDNDVLLAYKVLRMIISVASFAILRVTGQVCYKALYLKNLDKPHKIKHIDWYSLFALWILLPICFNSYGVFTQWFRFIGFVLISYWFCSQINRVEQGKPKKMFLSLAAISIIPPYYKFMDNLNVPDMFITELRLLALIVIVTFLFEKIWTDTDRQLKIMGKIHTFVIILSAFVLLKDVAMDNYLADRLILGVLSLLAIGIGMQLKAKIYLFSGIVTLVFNILIQTKQLWLSIPWWGYLLIAGLVLIGMASYNEIRKNEQKKSKIDDDDI
jgi:hypothetical protein